MSEELDVFASAVTKSAAPKPQQPQQQQGSGGNNGPKAEQLPDSRCEW